MKILKELIIIGCSISAIVPISIFLTGCSPHNLPPSSYLGEWRTGGGTFQRMGAINARLIPPLEEVWRVKAGKGIIGSPVPAGPLLVVPTTDGKVKAFLIEDGDKIWETKIKGGFFAAPVVSNTRIFISSEYPDGTLYCLDIRDGDIIWRKTIGASRSTSTIDGGIIYTLTNSGEVYAHNTIGGNLIWKKDVGSLIPQSPIASGDSLYVMSGGDTLKVLSTFDGDVLANVALPRHTYPTVAMEDHRLIFGSRTGVGSISAALVGEMEFFSAPKTYRLAVSDDIVIGIDGVRGLFALDTRSGIIRWSHSTSGLLESAPVIIDTMSLIVTIAGEVWLFDTASGKILWETNLDTPVSSTPTASGDILIIATEKGELIAYATKRSDAVPE
jgi:outer membrane protein assembly factor BamB